MPVQTPQKSLESMLAPEAPQTQPDPAFLKSNKALKQIIISLKAPANLIAGKSKKEP